MKKIITTFTVYCVLCTVYFNAAFASSVQCSQTEQALQYEMNFVGQPRTIEEHVRTARIYRAMATRGCPGNADTFREYSRASLDTARSLVYIEGYSGAEKARYDAMIKSATGF